MIRRSLLLNTASQNGCDSGHGWEKSKFPVLCAERNFPPPYLHGIPNLQEVHVKRITLNDGRFYEGYFV